MNTTCYLINKNLFLVDCGLRFADPTKLGVDAVIPAVDEYFQQAGGVTAYLITHAHEDHLGALPFVLPRWPAPVYTTPWTAEVLKYKLRKRNLDERKFLIHVVRPGEIVRAKDFEVEWIHVNHSIPNASALYIRTPAGTVFHTGDFKFDRSPVLEEPMSQNKLSEIGTLGVDLLLSDSTNADKSGMCPSESSVYAPLLNLFEKTSGAIVISTFASNFWRLKTIADICEKTGRKLYISGQGLEQSFAIAKSLSIYSLPESIRLSDDSLGSCSRSKLVVLATGCQGEFRSALSRIAFGEHRHFQIHTGDTVILSSRIIPGNERAILNTIDNLRKRGAQIVTTKEIDAIHVSGHAYQGDLETLIKLLNPKCYSPIHGSYSHMKSNFLIGEKILDNGKKTALIESGQVLELSDSELTIRNKIPIELNFIDRDSGVVLSGECVRKRLKIGELGLLIISGVYSRDTHRWIVNPEFDAIGLSLPSEISPDEWTKKQIRWIEEKVNSELSVSQTDVSDISESIRVYIRRLLFQILRKKPVVIMKLQFISNVKQ